MNHPSPAQHEADRHGADPHGTDPHGTDRHGPDPGATAQEEAGPHAATDHPHEVAAPHDVAAAPRRRRGPGPFTLLVLPGLTVLIGCAVFLTVTGRLPGTGSDGPAGQDERPPTAAERVDRSYVPWLKEAAKKCAAVRPSVLAAQIEARSGWNTDSAALSGATGIAGFGAAQWRVWGGDADGNGRSSPLDAADAIMALGRQDCALAAEMAELRTRGTVTGELLDLTLAAYTAGRGSVETAGRVPAKAAPYVKEIGRLASGYAEFDASDLSPGSQAPPPSMLRRPVGTTVVSSPYGTRAHPLTGVTKLHTGVDFAAGRGAPVTAAWQGTVVFASLTKAYGNRVVVDHGSVGGKHLQTTYSHLSVLRVARGESVTVGTVLGDVGSTGLSTGPHLHFEVVLDGYYTDPLPWLG
ncbi:M23 family metallopeptidase [Streptomyces sp. NPDC091272]|uniref:M23 family metallopeptidase n=1 Tax=Streptomyces sp. NPDC091272 TaxID=3365981 RepID=UPI0037F328A2